MQSTLTGRNSKWNKQQKAFRGTYFKFKYSVVTHAQVYEHVHVRTKDKRSEKINIADSWRKLATRKVDSSESREKKAAQYSICTN